MIVKVNMDTLGGKKYACIRNSDGVILNDEVASPDLIEKMGKKDNAYFNAEYNNGKIIIGSQVEDPKW